MQLLLCSSWMLQPKPVGLPQEENNILDQIKLYHDHLLPSKFQHRNDRALPNGHVPLQSLQWRFLRCSMKRKYSDVNVRKIDMKGVQELLFDSFIHQRTFKKFAVAPLAYAVWTIPHRTSFYDGIAVDNARISSCKKLDNSTAILSPSSRTSFPFFVINVVSSIVKNMFLTSAIPCSYALPSTSLLPHTLR